MTNLNIFIYLFNYLIIYTTAHSLPLDATTAQSDETVAFLVPYAIKYVPVEVPDEYINKNLAIPTQTFFNPEDFLRQIQEQNPEFVINTRKDTEDLPINLQNTDNLVIVPHTAIIENSQMNTLPQSEVLKDKTKSSDLFNHAPLARIPVKETFFATSSKLVNTPSSTESVDPSTSAITESADASTSPTAEYSTVENVPTTSSRAHVISKRQAPGFFYYRPVFRYSSVSSRRRRIHRPSRKHAMVGYLSDRDFFPTVA